MQPITPVEIAVAIMGMGFLGGTIAGIIVKVTKGERE